MTNRLLILDLDETLIFGTKEKLDRKEDFEIFGYYVYQRPFLSEFIKGLSNYYKLAIWSSAGENYVQGIAEKIRPELIKFEFVWSREKTVYQRNFDEINDHEYDNHYHYVKPLKKVKKLGYDLRHILIVDDSPYKSKLNYGNAIYPRAYNGDINDDELKVLKEYLIRLHDKEDFRKIEKRNWRQIMKRNHG